MACMHENKARQKTLEHNLLLLRLESETKNKKTYLYIKDGTFEITEEKRENPVAIHIPIN